MTHTTSVVHDGVEGDHRVVVADVDITSLDAAGSESFDPDAEFNLAPCHGASVLQQENPGYRVAATQANDLAAKYANYDAAADGQLIDVPSGTDVGVVRLRFEGDPAP